MKEEEGKLGCDDEAKEVESPEMAEAGLCVGLVVGLIVRVEWMNFLFYFLYFILLLLFFWGRLFW